MINGEVCIKRVEINDKTVKKEEIVSELIRALGAVETFRSEINIRKELIEELRDRVRDKDYMIEFLTQQNDNLKEEVESLKQEILRQAKYKRGRQRSEQVLSVADFGIIIDLVNRELFMIERKETPVVFNQNNKKEIERQQKEIDRRYEERINSPVYKSLKHLKNSLENLNIEVETPNLEVADNEQKDSN